MIKKKIVQLNKIAPNFIVDDVKETVGFYTGKLGFKVDWIGETPLFAIINKGNVTIMLRQLKRSGLVRPNRIPYLSAGWHTEGAGAWDVYVWVEEIDTLYQAFIKNGVRIIKPIENTEYGNRDFEIEDNNGYILCFGQPI